jgi:hypothetical protein
MAGVLVHLRWPPIRRQPIITPVRVNPSVLELEAAKEILSEIFGAKPGEVEEMIRQRLADRSGIYPPNF